MELELKFTFNLKIKISLAVSSICDNKEKCITLTDFPWFGQ